VFLLLSSCSSIATDEASSSDGVTPPSPKRINLADLRTSVLALSDLPGVGWQISDRAVTIGQSDGRQWQPRECGTRLNDLFDSTLAPSNDDFVSITFEQSSGNEITQNIARRDKPLSITEIADSFTSLIADCPSLTSESITLTLAPVDVADAAGIKINYAVAEKIFTLTIIYSQVGSYLLGLTHTGIFVTTAELQRLVDRANAKLGIALDEAPSINDGIASA
jgi:hypothetical protein